MKREREGKKVGKEIIEKKERGEYEEEEYAPRTESARRDPKRGPLNNKKNKASLAGVCARNPKDFKVRDRESSPLALSFSSADEILRSNKFSRSSREARDTVSPSRFEGC